MYDRPAQSWIEALPLGNGRLGAMVYGEPFEGSIQMNEESVVYGGPIDRLNPQALTYLPKIRALIKEGKIQEAEEMEVYALSGIPQSERPYQTLCDVFYKIKHEEEDVDSYRRELNLESGITTVAYTQNGVEYKMENFISLEEDVFVTAFSSGKIEGISMSVLMTRGRFYNCAGKAGEECIFIDGDLGKGGSEFCVQAKASVIGGKAEVIGEHLVITKADKVILYTNGVTTFPYRRKKIQDCSEYLKNQLSHLDAGRYEEIKEKHIKRHKEMFSRSLLFLEDKESLENNKRLMDLPTDQRIKRLAEGKADLGLEALYYAYGRYLLMASSQPGGLPANLQGIWCEKLEPTWDSKYTININTEMNYWLAENCNLSECHEPLFDLLERMVENGRRTAAQMYGCRGFVAHHNTDVWADTAPQDLAVPATYWVMGGAWLATHIWKHYRYTMDKDFLQRMFPVLKECVQFFMDFLIEDQGEMVTCPSVSPENTYVMKNGETGRACMGCTMDVGILRDVFGEYLESADILGDDREFQRQAKEMMERFPSYKVGKHGQLMEWRVDYDEWEIGHRHFSHLYPMFPSNQINEYDTPELVEACRKALERRMEYGGGHTGWSCAWLINLYARLQDGQKAEESLRYLITKLTAPNMFDLHPPLDRITGIPWVFQIDGNFGGTCGIAQMLLQSHLDEMFLLPALPESWKCGKVTGLCAEGGFVIDMEWEEHRLEEAVLLSNSGQTAKIRSHGKLRIECDGKPVAYENDDKGRYIFKTSRGCTYHITGCI
ncbi:MAG: glycoside hydrolase family 95 protein [Clostridia bacterium]|nr:glycoside hydrolase family 95 protein [Clostridia bacterium]NCC44020.1 glycoside hydrolase family 95 protein [Clostridia bacterium]